MKQIMLTVPPFDANAARYALELMGRMTVPAGEVMAFLTLRLALEEVANSTQEAEASDNGDN